MTTLRVTAASCLCARSCVGMCAKESIHSCSNCEFQHSSFPTYACACVCLSVCGGRGGRACVCVLDYDPWQLL